MANQYRRLQNMGGTPREVAEVVNNVMEGKINSTGEVTLATGGATTTTLIDRRIGPDSIILFAPNSVSAAAANFYPYGTFERRADITFASANTPQVLTLTEDEYSYGMSLASNKITVDYGGVYDLDISVLFANDNNSIRNAYLWVRVNGTDYPHSGTKFAVVERHGGTTGYAPVAINHPLELAANDYVEVVGAVSHADVYIEHNDAITSPFTMPATPAIMVNLMMVDPSGVADSAFEMFVTNKTKGQATINHLPNSLSNKTFGYLIIG